MRSKSIPRRLRIPRSRKTSRKGVSAAEFALLAPLLVALFLTSVDLGQFLNSAQQVNSISREAARMASRDETKLVSEVEDYALQRLIDSFPQTAAEQISAAATIEVTDGMGVAITNGDLTTVPAGQELHVEIGLTYGTIRWLSGFPYASNRVLSTTTSIRRQ